MKLQHTATRHAATHCNTLATHCNTLQRTATHCNTLQHAETVTVKQDNRRRTPPTIFSVTPVHNTTTCINTFATCCNTLQHTQTHCNTLQHTATHNVYHKAGQKIFDSSYQSAQHTCHTLATHLQHTCITLQYTATHFNTL